MPASSVGGLDLPHLRCKFRGARRHSESSPERGLANRNLGVLRRCSIRDTRACLSPLFTPGSAATQLLDRAIPGDARIPKSARHGTDVAVLRTPIGSSLRPISRLRCGRRGCCTPVRHHRVHFIETDLPFRLRSGTFDVVCSVGVCYAEPASGLRGSGAWHGQAAS